MSPKRREDRSVSSKRTSKRQLAEVRAEFRAAIFKLKALGCEDSMVLVEFWHALDCVNGEEIR
jgi:hypothetical protein